MKLKQKNRIWLILLVTSSLLLGLGIQLALAAIDSARSRAQAQELAAGAVDMALSAAGESLDNARALERLRQANLDIKAQEAAELREKQELLILANPWNPIPEGYVPELGDVGGGHRMDVRCVDALLEMMEDCRAAGNYPYICSSYRTQLLQQWLYDNKVFRVIMSGTPLAEAPAVAARSVAFPGTSEHQLGLAVDIVDLFYTNLDEGQENTNTQKWLMANSWRYGFILRYPNGSTDITGIIYEPWHYRYVGEEFAREIFELDVTLEEYLQLRRGR